MNKPNNNPEGMEPGDYAPDDLARALETADEAERQRMAAKRSPLEIRMDACTADYK